jgi:thiol-disulfide isomerase/thioredoxin
MNRTSLFCLAILTSTTLTFGDEPARPAPRPKPSEILEKTWPDHPEWVAMLVDILQGSQLGPGEGWFKKAVSQTRFTWDATRKNLDKDGDGSISKAEFAGKPADFATLDRDRDGFLTAPDFDFSPHALTPSPGMMLYYAADRDGNGKVSREEFDGVFRALDSGGLGFLSQDDLRRAFATSAPRPRPSTPSPSASGPTKWTLVKGLFRQEIGSLQPGPKLDEAAPDFALLTVDGKDAVMLSKKVGPKPVVLIFGNFTCGPFRSQAGNIEKLHQRYKDRATFLMVYVREAHPTDGWAMESNDRVGVTLRQPRTYDERVEVARKCVRTLDFDFPVLVDSIDDSVGARYSGMPGRFYLIDPEGTVAYKSGRGPFGFKPAELEQSLVMLLKQTEKPEPPTKP